MSGGESGEGVYGAAKDWHGNLMRACSSSWPRLTLGFRRVGKRGDAEADQGGRSERQYDEKAQPSRQLNALSRRAAERLSVAAPSSQHSGPRSTEAEIEEEIAPGGRPAIAVAQARGAWRKCGYDIIS